MRRIEIEESGLINGDDAVYPSLIRLDERNIIAGFSLGGPSATGGTHWARSADGGRSWAWGGTILHPDTDPPTRNTLRLSRSEDGTFLAYGMRAEIRPGKIEFAADKRREGVLCRSVNEGRSWSAPEVILAAVEGGWEISNPIVELDAGRWLAPAATLAHPDRLGERVITRISDDFGRTWSDSAIVFQEPDGRMGFFENKLIKIGQRQLLATAWTVLMGSYLDVENHFAISRNGGESWSSSCSTGISGQTLTPIWLRGNELLVLYNRRRGHQSIQIALVHFSDTSWSIECEHTLYDAQSTYEVDVRKERQTDEFKTFRFGLPCAIQLTSETILAAYWCQRGEHYEVRWSRIRLN